MQIYSTFIVKSTVKFDILWSLNILFTDVLLIRDLKTREKGNKTVPWNI